MRPGSIVTTDTPCAYSGYPHGGIISANTPGVWSPRYGAVKFHPECLDLRKGETPEADNPAPVPGEDVPAIPAVPAPVPAKTAVNANGDAASRLAAAIAELAQSGTKPIDRDEVAAIVRSEIEAVKDTIGIRRYEVTRKDHPAVDCGIQHHCFPQVLDLVCNQADSYLWGPAGTGKTQMAINAAKTLGLSVAVLSMSPQTTATKLEGYMSANGEYVPTDFYRMFSSGGVFIVDELDNMSASVATTLNSALANSLASFPCGTIERHPDFIFVGTGNTDGRGPTHQYPERRKLDSATLSRLRFLRILPDTQLEFALAVAHAGGKDDQAKKWAKWVQDVRDHWAKPGCGITGTLYADMRAIITGAKEIAAPYTWSSIEGLAESTVFKGLPADQSSRVLSAVPLPQGVL